MAKGSGSAGRTGRTRPEEGPPIVDLPPGIGKRPRTRGRGRPGTGTGITGISGEYEPRPDLEWYDNDKRPVKVSDRVYTPEKGENVGTFNKALENMDKVHAVRAEQKPMQMRSRSNLGEGVLGQHVGLSFVDTTPGPNAGKVREYSDIVLSNDYDQKNEPAKRGTLYHETGHGHDFGQNYEEKVIPNSKVGDQYHKRKFDSENAFRKIEMAGGSLEPNSNDTPTTQWAKSVQRSKSYNDLVKKRDRARIEKNRNTVRFLNYLLDPKELYARSYTQYISKHADPSVMKDMREKYNKQDDNYKRAVGFSQWRGKDFDSVDASFDRIFGSRGLDTKNQALPTIVPIKS